MVASSALALALSPCPARRAPAAPPEPPDIPAKAWLLIDADDRTRLAAHDPDTSRAMASTTKLMTAYLSLSRAAARRDADGAALPPDPRRVAARPRAGERMTVRDLLYGLLLPSGNDAAVTLADGVAGSTAAFVREMNEAARRLGLDETSYANPIGLDAPGNYSSPRDLANLALDPPPRRAVPADREHASDHAPHRRAPADDREPQRPRRSPMPWINGVKTGYTPDAGNVLVAPGTRNGVTLLSVVMGASSIPRPRQRHAGAPRLRVLALPAASRLCSSGETLAPPASRTPTRALALEARARLERDRSPRAERRRARHAPRSIEAPVHRGERVGVAQRRRWPGSPSAACRVARGRGGVKPTPDPRSRDVDDALPGPRVVVWIVGVGLVAIVILIGTALVRRPG